jgi:hypothetical protein
MGPALIKKNANSLMAHMNYEKTVNLTQSIKRSNVEHIKLKDAVFMVIGVILFTNPTTPLVNKFVLI